MPSLTPSKSMLPKRPQMGRLKSWSAGLGAKLSASSSNADQDITIEVEQRKKGVDSLYASTEAYWSYLGKKKPVPFDASSLSLAEDANGASISKPESKMLPIEALGLAMSSYSTAFPDTSAYGSCLGLLGEAHIKLANLQSTFTKDTSHIFLARIARSRATLDSFAAALKKLDTATARLEAAQTKVQKSKKEKRELEEELRLARASYDEAVTDVELRGEAVKECEAEDWVCLTTYMQAQLDYVAQSQAVLEQVKAMWSEAPTATPMTRPRSLSGPKARPSISRRSSAKDGSEVTATRFGSRSSLSLSTSERRSSIDDRDTEKAKEKKSRLRMPSFSNNKASDAVASVTSGIGSSLSRARGSTLFSGSAEPSPEKEGKWNFISRSTKKDQGFMSMDDAEVHHQDRRAPPPALPIRPSVSAMDVTLGGGESDADVGVARASIDSDSSASDVRHRASPFSRNTGSNGYLDVHRSTAHETIHERGESQLSELHMDPYLGGSASAPLGLHHTGLSAYSEVSNGDPFSGGNAVMSPQATGGRFDTEDEHEDEDDDEVERQGLTGGGERMEGGWRSVLNGTPLPSASGNGSGRGRGSGEMASLKARLPPPVPSASYLLKSKPRPPPPPPLPSRNS